MRLGLYPFSVLYPLVELLRSAEETLKTAIEAVLSLGPVGAGSGFDVDVVSKTES